MVPVTIIQTSLYQQLDTCAKIEICQGKEHLSYNYTNEFGKTWTIDLYIVLRVPDPYLNLPAYTEICEYSPLRFKSSFGLSFSPQLALRSVTKHPERLKKWTFPQKLSLKYRS